ncbi:MAG: L-glutamate gamma-semialdehyde dehydrogenase [Chlorobi bacterium]|nr:L-glutamate gamma-semialdehyde dehydrogenase [Chlorobiota bacterium]MCI0717154.1 L-glutamate gamma-semialdehyde dehydrogenase [Chlorobiota bacterium]
MKPFKNEPLTDFTKKKNFAKFKEALEKVHAELDKEYPLIIGGEKIFTEDKIASVNPSNISEIVGRVSKANPELANRAVETAYTKFSEWKQTPAKKRSKYLLETARLMRKRKFELAAWMVYETGKNWAEADGDVAEAIDFLEFYAREVLRYDKGVKLVKIKGESNYQEYIPLGAGVVIPPWNFPLAILTGMTSAAVVTGNTVVLKPSSDSPVIASKLMELLEEAGLPAGVVNFLPGSGGLIGDMLVSHPLTRFVSFTGSREVGLHINELAAKTQQGQKWIKRVAAEMGGKDAIVIDDELKSLEEAAAGVITSAFGYQGQKCSACSRVIVSEKIFDQFLDLLVDKASALKVGPADENPNVASVINKRSEDSILNYIQKGVSEGGRIAFGGGKAQGNGYFIQPTIIADVKPTGTIAQEEIFGPVLAVIKAKDFDEGLQIANNTAYGLTGAAYSKSKKKLKKAAREFFVGNLYLNRKCTGAMVGVHPFGGFNMSGTCSKAGGFDYLLLFMQTKVVAEKKFKK